MASRSSNEKASFSSNRRAACSVVVMLQVWYAITFLLDSHLGDFHFFTFSLRCKV